jgi:hypothetical protein
MRRRTAATIRTIGAAALWLWGGFWFLVGILAGVLWSIILVGAVSAAAGYRLGRYE